MIRVLVLQYLDNINKNMKTAEINVLSVRRYTQTLLTVTERLNRINDSINY